jgi:hypothetical protein
VFGSAVCAWAGDLCITLNGTDTVVGKSFKVPKKNTCRPFAGFQTSEGFYSATVTGDACVAARRSTRSSQMVAMS